MHSEVTNVPKGSGLGTSSILSAACVKAVFEFMGIEYTEKDLYAHVLAMEQIMSTGGGWQDQVGGITPGLKYITSMPGIDQQLKVTHVDIPEFAKRELDDRFVLIYVNDDGELTYAADKFYAVLVQNGVSFKRSFLT